MPQTPDPSTTRSMRHLGAAALLVLLVQLVLGLANTFWLDLPDSGSGWAGAAPAGLLMAHVGLGALLLVLGVWIAVLAWRRRERTWLTATAVAVLGIVVAIGAGSAFMGQVSDDGASFLMGLGTAIAIAGYAYGLYRAPEARRAA